MLNPKLVPMNALVNLTDPTTPCFFISSPVDGSSYFPIVRMDGWESAQEDLLSYLNWLQVSLVISIADIEKHKLPIPSHNSSSV